MDSVGNNQTADNIQQIINEGTFAKKAIITTKTSLLIRALFSKTTISQFQRAHLLVGLPTVQ